MKAIVLFLWITGCIGPTCPVEEYDIIIFPAEEMPRCEFKLKSWEAITKKHDGICLRIELKKDGSIEWPTE